MHKGKRMCVVIGRRIRMIFLCFIFLVSTISLRGELDEKAKFMTTAF